MINRLIELSLRNRFLVMAGALPWQVGAGGRSFAPLSMRFRICRTTRSSYSPT